MISRKNKKVVIFLIILSPEYAESGKLWYFYSLSILCAIEKFPDYSQGVYEETISMKLVQLVI